MLELAVPVQLPTPMLPEFPPTIAFPPTWLVIDNGHPSDAEVSEKIVEYITRKFPPVLARRKMIPTGEKPDAFDLLAHGLIVVGGTSANPFIKEYLDKMDPTFDIETLSFVKRATAELPEYRVPGAPGTSVISSCQGALPWLQIWWIHGWTAEDTVAAGELFRAGERKGIWVNKEKVADP